MRRLALVGLLLSGSAFAHHGHVVEFDVQNRVRLSGVVQEAKFTNPHSEVTLVVLDTTDGGIGSKICRVVLDAPSVLLRQRAVRNFQVGQWVELSAYPHRQISRDCHYWSTLRETELAVLD